MDFAGTHFLSIDQFERTDVERLFAVADRLAPYARRERCTDVLRGAILGNMFFEPSTRTRVSFGCAFNLLGGAVRETTGFEHTSVAKGESLYDTARVMSGYSDVIVLRHPEVGSAVEFSSASRVPVINAGDGSNEHPSQALLDLYTISREQRRLSRNMDQLRITLVGDLRYGRAVHSLCKLLACFAGSSVRLVSPRSLAAPPELVEQLRGAGLEVVVSTDMPAHIRDVDIIYATRIQEERFDDPREAAQYQDLYHLDQPTYTAHCQPNTVIMHPLPRDSRRGRGEVDQDLNEHPNLAIFRQAENGLLVRMALFALVLDVVDEFDAYSFAPRWRTVRRSS